ncbi:MAG: AI-2E family transporter [Candidatus Electryoneaceae bacterium]|nr:AI-2E family transporter [Candidatus Electryoneaceae bacterium]
MGVVLILFAFLLFLSKGYLTVLAVSAAILVLLYPFRSVIAIRPFIILVSLVMILAIWSRFGSLLAPFLVAFLVAYAINPVVEWLVGRKLPRVLVILVIIGSIAGAMVGIGFLIVPRLIREITNLASDIPQWVKSVELWGETSLLPWLSKFLPIEGIIERFQSDFPETAKSVMGNFADWSKHAIRGTVSLLSGLLNVILIPILAVYYLNDYKRIKQKVYDFVPAPHQTFAKEIYFGLNRMLAGYMRGQMLVILFLSTWIGLGLWLIAGLPYALLLGLLAGLLNLFPYIGASTALLLTIIVSLFQPEPVSTMIKALIVFLSAQILESNFITSRLVGDRVGLHPVAVIFLIFLFATLFGFIGMLIAIPVGGSVVVITKIWMTRRRNKSPE